MFESVVDSGLDYISVKPEKIIQLQDLSCIKPKVKSISDKYSWNLYKLLHKITSNRDTGKYVKNQLRVYWRKSSWFDGKITEFKDVERIDTRQILISPFGKGSFYNLGNIMGERGNQEWALIYPESDLEDVTEWFFNTYERDGRCVFDREHRGWWKGEDGRFTYSENESKRICSWCGVTQHKHIEKVVKEVITWESEL